MDAAIARGVENRVTSDFTVPSRLKAWIDRILTTGKAFRYGKVAPVGLVGDKCVIVSTATRSIVGCVSILQGRY